MFAEVVEVNSRAGDQRWDCGRDQDLAGSGMPCNSRRDVDRDAADVGSSKLDLTGVKAGSRGEPAASQSAGDRGCAADRAGRAVERRDDAVAGGLDQATPEVRDVAGRESLSKTITRLNEARAAM